MGLVDRVARDRVAGDVERLARVTQDEPGHRPELVGDGADPMAAARPLHLDVPDPRPGLHRPHVGDAAPPEFRGVLGLAEDRVPIRDEPRGGRVEVVRVEMGDQHRVQVAHDVTGRDRKPHQRVTLRTR